MILKAYASYFVSYLLNNLKSLDNVIRIVLYGSVAKDEVGKDSDIDIFIEIKEKTLNFEKQIKYIEKTFYESREAALFKTWNIDNRFSIKTGKLKEWRELYRIIASSGIVLYGPYEAKELPSGIKHFIIVYWDEIGKNRGSFLNKLYGFKIKEKRYQGILSKFNGRKIGKSCVMLPVEYKEDIFKVIKEHKVKARVLEVFS